MTKINVLLEETKKNLKPSTKIFKEVDAFISNINKNLQKKKINANCVAGGSVAKETFLKNDFDIDLFVRFDKSYKNETLSKRLESVLPKAERIHGSRDYFQIKKKDLIYEIVPVYNVTKSSEAVNVTDMSPLHVGWVKKYTSKNKNLADEIRLAKQFCKSIKVYGAESYIKGFSGHILDILVIYYGSFEKLLKASLKWKPQVVIDPEKQVKNPLWELNSSKLQSPIVIIDPLQKNRNAAAALGLEKFEIFKLKAKEFLKKPSNEFFKINPLSEKEIKKIHKELKNKLFVLIIDPTKDKRDVAGSKVLKVHTFFKKALENNDFKILKTNWEFGYPSLSYFIVKDETLSPTQELRGPPVNQKVHAENFKSAHKKTKVKDGILYATENRLYRQPDALIKDMCKQAYIKDRVKRVRVR